MANQAPFSPKQTAYLRHLVADALTSQAAQLPQQILRGHSTDASPSMQPPPPPLVPLAQPTNPAGPSSASPSEADQGNTIAPVGYRVDCLASGYAGATPYDH